jgi:hypothetical protein
LNIVLIWLSATSPFERFGHQRRQPIGNQRKSEQHHGNDRNRGRERPADNGGNAAAAGSIVIHPRAACDQFGRQCRIANFKTRQRGCRQAAQAQHAGRAVGPADIGISPRRERLFVFVDLEPVGKTERNLAPPARHPVEIDSRSASLRFCGL